MEDYRKNKIKNYYKNKNNISKLVEKYTNKSNENIIYKIINNLAHRATNYLKKKNIERKFTHMELIGCNQEELKLHLEKQLKDEMNFDNYGEWEIDHIKPISLFDLNNENELLECFNYKNLQPLWMTDNRIKHNKYI